MEKERKVTEHITMHSDGKMRWQYDVNLYRTPIIYFLIWKIFFFIITGIFIVVFLADIGNEGFFWQGFFKSLKIYGYFMAGMTAISGLSYLIYASMMGGYYSVKFEMDENGINHEQTAEGAKKVKKIAKATSIAGASSGSLTTMGVGMNSARTAMYSDFQKVKKIKCRRRFNLIKLNAPFNHNQVYVFDEDFEFVKNYIVEHCPNAKK